MKKINEEQLKGLQTTQGKINNILLKIGVLESQKHSHLHNLASLNKDIEDYKKELEEEYGSIDINLEDGSYTNIELNKE